MREPPVERALCKAVEAEGGIAYKFVSPGHRGVPDRIVLLPIPLEHRELVARYFRLVETKAGEDGVVEPHQAREHERLRALGYTVEVVSRK